MGSRAFLLLGLLVAGAAAAEPKVRLFSRSRRPGEAVLVVVTGHDPARPPSGTFGGAPLHFWPASKGTYLSVAGIDLDVSTGTSRFELKLRGPRGRERAWREAVTVRPKTHATRKLTVAPQYVEPGPELEARADEETARLKALFAKATEGAAMDGRFRMPIRGAKTTSRFGERSEFNGQARAPHSGADIKASTGTPVLAPQAGTVALVEDLYFPGKTLLLDHGAGVYSLFAHLSEVLVPVGKRVRPGEKVARAGATGRVTGPHLHWAVRVQGARVDPQSLMSLPLERWLKRSKGRRQKRTRR